VNRMKERLELRIVGNDERKGEEKECFLNKDEEEGVFEEIEDAVKGKNEFQIPEEEEIKKEMKVRGVAKSRCEDAMVLRRGERAGGIVERIEVGVIIPG
jgi:hypothetical protein